VSNKQWGHGFRVGCDQGSEEGYQYGLESGIGVGGMDAAEKINILICSMVSTLSEKGVCPEFWLTLRMISEINAKNMLTE